MTHGGPRIGLGHVSRCLALARSLSALGADVDFVLGTDQPTAAIVRAAGFAAAPVAWEEDASAAIAAVQHAHAPIVVVDSYAASPALFAALRPVVDTLVAIDDLADRRVPADIVVNGAVGAEGLPYDTSDGGVFLLGNRYALVDRRYAARNGRVPRATVQRVLVALGGSEQVRAATAAVAATVDALDAAAVDLVTGPHGSAEALGAALAGVAEGRVSSHGAVADLAPLMRAADLAIAGAGMTLYELAAVGTPTIMVMTAGNQARNVRRFEEAGAALYAGRADGEALGANVEARVRELGNDSVRRAEIGEAARRLVDGGGADRVARVLVHAAAAGR